MFLRDRYETRFGICNHEISDSGRPLALIAHQWEEDTLVGSLLRERIELYLNRGIQAKFGYNLTEFLELPHEICVLLLEIAGQKQIEEGNVMDDLQSQINKLK